MSEAAKKALRVFRQRRREGKKLRYRKRFKRQRKPFTLSPGQSPGKALFDYCTFQK